MYEALTRVQAPVQETGSVVGFLKREIRAHIADVGSLFMPFRGWGDLTA